MTTLLQFAIYNLQFTLIYQLSIFNTTTVRKWQMLNAKLLLNGKCEMLNANGVSL